ncbi:MAG: hypothetical protein RBQ89_06010, partial [Sphaerochaeta sp.]|nr:hypothetical protein [Sphaerochaeta sp.]
MKIRKQTTRLLMAVIAALALMSSCTITENISFKQTGYHASAYAFSVEDFFIAVLEDFSEFSTENEDISLMDKAIGDFEKALRYSPTTKNVGLKKLDEHAYEGVFEFTDLMRLVTDLGAGENQSLLDINGNSMTFFLSMDNYEQLVPVIPFLADENFEA